MFPKKWVINNIDTIIFTCTSELICLDKNNKKLYFKHKKYVYQCLKYINNYLKNI